MSLLSQAEQRLTLDVVQSVAFRPARLGRRGLDEQHVRAFCQQVEAELVALLAERAALQEEVGRLRRRMTARPDGEGGYREDANVQAVSVLSRARDTADHYVAEAQEYSRNLAQDARRRRDEILAQARSHADRALAEAHGEASRAARAAMAPLPHATGTLPPAAADIRRQQGELAYLRAFSEVYRTHLLAYLDLLLRNVDEREHPEPEPAERPALSAVPPEQPATVA
jgi:cell division septum initiation protein DivIVA